MAFIAAGTRLAANLRNLALSVSLLGIIVGNGNVRAHNTYVNVNVYKSKINASMLLKLLACLTKKCLDQMYE